MLCALIEFNTNTSMNLSSEHVYMNTFQSSTTNTLTAYQGIKWTNMKKKKNYEVLQYEYFKSREIGHLLSGRKHIVELTVQSFNEWNYSTAWTENILLFVCVEHLYCKLVWPAELRDAFTYHNVMVTDSSSWGSMYYKPWSSITIVITLVLTCVHVITNRLTNPLVRCGIINNKSEKC